MRITNNLFLAALLAASSFAVNAQTVASDPGVDFLATKINSISMYSDPSGSEYGIYSFNSAGGYSSIKPVYLNPDLAATVGIIYNGWLHLVTHTTSQYSGDAIAVYTRFNAKTWEVDSTHYQIPVNYNLAGTDFTYDQDSDKVIGCVKGDTEGTFYNLVTIDFEKNPIAVNVIGTAGDTSKVAEHGFKYATLAENSKGELYGIGSDGILYSINKATAEKKAIKQIDVYHDGVDYFQQSMTFDASTDKLYWASAFTNPGTSGLYEVNVKDATCKKLFTFKGEEVFTTLTVPQPEYSRSAPAKTQNLAYDTLRSHVTFTAPTKTVNGTAITGDLTYYIYEQNGDTLATGSVAAGGKVDADVALQKGMNVIVATTNNDAGASPIARLYQWNAGDVPLATDSVWASADAENNSKVLVSWNAVTKGIHNGEISADEVTYDVTRYPDSTVVAKGIKATTYTDSIAEVEPRVYSYGVLTHANSLTSEETKSNKIAAGDHFDVPYLEDFENGDDFLLFTVLNLNNDSVTRYINYANTKVPLTWTWNNVSHVADIYGSDSIANDWLITPEILLEGGKTYSLKFNQGGYSYWTEDKLGVAYGQGIDPAAYVFIQGDTTKVKKGYGDDAWELKQYDITPTLTGKYRFGFHDASTSLTDQHGIRIDNISFREAQSSGISAVSTSTAADVNAPAYNLAGQRVSPGFRGIVIQNGKKRIVR